MLSGEHLYLPPDRVYGSYEDMIEKEKSLPEESRMEIVSIVTPNHLHFQPAKAALQNGFHVILDKPMTFNLEQAKELKQVIENSNRLFCLTHTYTGYPMIKEAKQIVASGKLGTIRKIYVAYPQGWLSNREEGSGNKQAEWRTDPARSGIAGCMGDIGTHAFNMAEYVSGLQVTKICADLNVMVEGRKLDDDGQVLLKFNNGASGLLYASQIAAGEENNIRISIYGEKGGLEWQQENANSLLVKWFDKPTEILRSGAKYLGPFAAHNIRTPAGHPEGYLEAFANIYRNFALSVRAHISGETPKSEWLDFPGVDEGIRGMAFIENVVQSNTSDQKWSEFIV
jgi:predicted dehydrogenase